MSAMPQLTDELVSVGRIVPAVATAMLEGISMADLWWKSGSTTGGATRSIPSVAEFSDATRSRSAGTRSLSNTRASWWPAGRTDVGSAARPAMTVIFMGRTCPRGVRAASVVVRVRGGRLEGEHVAGFGAVDRQHRTEGAAHVVRCVPPGGVVEREHQGVEVLVHRDGLRAEDAWMTRGEAFLVVAEQRLVELLPGTEPGEPDVDVADAELLCEVGHEVDDPDG